ncbi:hypothetical protein [uncultured Arthrobacter sp.]|uniref:hypothetical protein n=1 Tax=uncultured Arthrobacter sp. TaxID=114050 RepID=UPI002629E034|nr:hypothetical protein [uncultured Arthrobacter sp.]
MTSEHPDGPARPPEGGQELKDAFRLVFDGQIPNYGDYNLVVASCHDGIADGSGPGRAFVVGYRWKPAELMIAPTHLSGITGAGVPAEVNMTNLAHALQWEDGSYEVGTSVGRIFRFGLEPEPVLEIGPGAPLRLDQADDVVDFAAFMTAFIAMA